MRASLFGATAFSLVGLAGSGTVDGQTPDVETEEVAAAPAWGAVTELTIVRSEALTSCSYPDVCETTTTTAEPVPLECIDLVPGASLRGCNFSGADLSGVDLSLASLSGANLTGVVWANTVCPDGSNSDTNGRNSCP